MSQVQVKSYSQTSEEYYPTNSLHGIEKSWIVLHHVKGNEDNAPKKPRKGLKTIQEEFMGKMPNFSIYVD